MVYIYTAIRNLVFRENKIAEWDLYGSLGIWSEDTDVRAKNAYDMQQVIRYHYAWCINPDGGMGRNTVECKCIDTAYNTTYNKDRRHENVQME